MDSSIISGKKKPQGKIKLVPVSKGHAPKGARGGAAVKALGRTKTTGNFKRIEAANNKALNLPEVKTALAGQGFSPWIGTAEDFDAFYRVERDKYAKVIKASGMDKE